MVPFISLSKQVGKEKHGVKTICPKARG